METKNYFQHDYRSRDDKKLLKVRMKHKMAGVGIYWCLVELLHEGMGYIDNDIETLSFQLQENEQIIKDVIEICFSISEDDKIFCNRVIENLQFREEKRQANIERAKKGAEARWKDKDTNSNNKDANSIPKANLKDRYRMLINAKEKEKEIEIDKETEIEIDKEIYNDQAIAKPKYKKILKGLLQVEDKQLFHNSWEDMNEVGFEIIAENNEWDTDVYNNYVERINSNYQIVNQNG